MSTVLCKIWVDPSGLKKPMLKALSEIERVYPGVVVTSTTEQAKDRLVYSLHYAGLAVDIRKVTYFGAEIKRDDLVECLSGDRAYQVIERQSFFHIEYDTGI